jgi:hypothetical protein
MQPLSQINSQSTNVASICQSTVDWLRANEPTKKLTKGGVLRKDDIVPC